MIKYKTTKYISSNSMSDLICNNYTMLLVMNRFGIDLGFGEATIGEVCKNSNVDVDTFLALVNILISKNKERVVIDYDKISLSTLINYLHNSHSYFLEYRLPSIRQKLVESLDSNDDVSVVIINYFDQYVAEVNRHMMYEEQTLFPYINAILDGSKSNNYSIDAYSKHHSKVEAKLSELKNIMIKYYPAKTTNELNSALYDIFSCEKDLASHNSIEDSLLVPAMKKFEQLNR